MRNFKLIIILAGLCLLVLSLSAQAERTQPAKAVVQKLDASVRTFTTKAEALIFNETQGPSVEKALNAGSRQGGDYFSDATLIPSLPYLDTGTTTGYNDDYDAQCPNASSAPEVVYYYIPASNERIHIWSCESAYWTKMYVYQNSDTLPDQEIACNQYSDSCADPYRAVIYDLSVTADDTFYIVVDGFSSYEGQYVIYVEARPPIDTLNIHPALADNNSFTGNILVNSYEWYEYDIFVPWWSSVDGGENWDGGFGFSFSNDTARYPAVDYWKEDTLYHGTVVPPDAWNNGAPNYLVNIYNGSDLSTIDGSYWSWNNYGWHDMEMVDIACVENDSAWFWGMQSMVHSTTYTTPDMTSGPHVFYPTAADGWATISWLVIDEAGTPMENCVSTTIDIDKFTNYGYAAYDHLDDSLGLYQLVIRMELTPEMADETGEVVTFTMDDSTNVMYPAVAAYGGNVVVVCENYFGLEPDDKDLVCFNTQSALASTMIVNDVVGTVEAERYPRVQHITGASFLCTYIQNNELYATLTEDGGLTWGTPEVISLPGDSVVSDYRAVDIAESDGYTAKIMYEYRVGGRGAGSIWLRLITHQVYPYPDADGDDVPDFADNCPNTPNPGQEDGDTDGVGNVCDNCPGHPNADQTNSDGDTFGDACDNCPTTDNEDQADGDTDGVGDACDNCVIIPNPNQENDDNDSHGNSCDNCPNDDNEDQSDIDGDQVGDVCDNCPEDFNPLQEDENQNGVGDVCDYMCGDCNDDALVNILDIQYLIAFLYFQGPPPSSMIAADVNDDELVNILDIQYLIAFLYFQGPDPTCS